MIPSPPTAALASQQGRQRLVQAMLDFTNHTALEATPYERELLTLFVRGDLTIDQVVAKLASSPTGGGTA
jgi:hypothetical protein